MYIVVNKYAQAHNITKPREQRTDSNEIIDTEKEVNFLTFFELELNFFFPMASFFSRDNALLKII